MKFETVLMVIIGSILIGVLGGFAARSIWIGIGLPIVLIVLGVMWLATRPAKEEPEEENKPEPEKPKQE